MYYNSEGSSHGFLLRNGTFTTLDYPGGYSQNYLWGINDQGVMVGAYGEPTTINGVSYAWEHAFIYQNGQFTNADVPFGPPAATQPLGITNNGVIAGECVDNSRTVYGYAANGRTVIDSRYGPVREKKKSNKRSRTVTNFAQHQFATRVFRARTTPTLVVIAVQATQAGTRTGTLSIKDSALDSMQKIAPAGSGT